MKKTTFNPWPIGLTAVLVCFCIIQFTLVTVAASGFEGLDDVEYYRHGVEYGKEIDRQERQMDLGWTIAHNLDQAEVPQEQFPIRIALLDFDHKPVMHAKVKLKIGRPATLRDDSSYELKEVGPGVYSGNVNLGFGKWKVDLEAEKGDNIVKVEFRHEVGPGGILPTEPVKVGAVGDDPAQVQE
jgi:nitrogen fixation protein FixH